MEVFYTGFDIIGNGKVALNTKSLSLNTNENYYQELKKVLKIRRVKDLPFVRIGKVNDGGYIMAGNLSQIGWGGRGIAYSFGISNEISWDVDMARRGYNIFMYDMTIDKLPYENEKFHFFKEGIGGVKDEEKLLDTLENFLKRNGHENKYEMILKMDVEGAEWDFLENVSLETLIKFDQIVFEFHSLTEPKTFSEMCRIINLIDKINKTHTLVHLHGNNNQHYINVENVGVIPNVLELTYLRTKNHNFCDDEIFLPSSLDSPNNPTTPDISLGYWNKFTH